MVEFLTEQGMVAEYSQEVVNKVASPSMDGGSSGADRDELFAQAGAFIIEKDKASIGMLQRAFLRSDLTARPGSWISWQRQELWAKRRAQNPERSL